MIRTPKQLAKHVCANYDDGRCVYCGSCKIVSGRPCEYFREAVLPPAGYAYCLQIKDLAHLRYKYSLIDPAVITTNETARKCTCGRSLAKGKRLCPDCRVKNRRKTWRSYKRSKRSSGRQLKAGIEP